MNTICGSCRSGLLLFKDASQYLFIVDTLTWYTLQVMRRYHIQNRDDYKKYNRIVGMITKLTNMMKQLDPQDTTRIELTEQLLSK
jgi:hypothetical protein